MPQRAGNEKLLREEQKGKLSVLWKKLHVTNVEEMRGILILKRECRRVHSVLTSWWDKVLETLPKDLGYDADVFLERLTHTQWTHFQTRKSGHRIK